MRWQIYQAGNLPSHGTCIWHPVASRLWTTSVSLLFDVVMQVNISKTRYLNCGKRYESMIHHRSYAQMWFEPMEEVLGSNPDQYVVDTRLSIVDWLICINWKSVSFWLRCRWSVDQESTEVSVEFRLRIELVSIEGMDRTVDGGSPKYTWSDKGT